MISAVGIVVPARDEAALLPACLASVAAAVELAPAGLEIGCTVVLDTCSDDSLAIVEAARHRHPFLTVLEVDARSAGAARARGLADLLERLSHHPREATWLASTDADSRVPHGWLHDQVVLADAGSDLVAGIIAIDDWADRPSQTSRRFRARYRIAADGTHDHVHGANLGVRASTYLAAGGMPPIPLSEDHALLDAVALAGATITRTAQIEVVTSARREARAPGGFGAFLTSIE